MNFGEKIKKLRIEREWKQQYVAERLGISVAAICRYESGMYEPKSLSIIKEFAELYGVTTDYLLNANIDYTPEETDKLIKWYNTNKENINEEDRNMFIRFMESYLKSRGD